MLSADPPRIGENGPWPGSGEQCSSPQRVIARFPYGNWAMLSIGLLSSSRLQKVV
jgi:hypothetical protein